jgi:hypothetical protein
MRLGETYMTKALDRWLTQATRHLSNDATVQIRTEIREHYEAAREAAFAGGATTDEADELAVTALGDARTANRQYRKVLLTAAEARLLREGSCGAWAICAHRRVRALLRWTPALALVAAGALFGTGASGVARILLVGGIALGLAFIAPFLPIYTPARSRMCRYGKYAAALGILVLAFGPDVRQYSLLIAALWPVVWIEWTRISIRRKVPVPQWPKHLYL